MYLRSNYFLVYHYYSQPFLPFRNILCHLQPFLPFTTFPIIHHHSYHSPQFLPFTNIPTIQHHSYHSPPFLLFTTISTIHHHSYHSPPFLSFTAIPSIHHHSYLFNYISLLKPPLTECSQVSLVFTTSLYYSPRCLSFTNISYRSLSFSITDLILYNSPLFPTIHHLPL